MPWDSGLQTVCWAHLARALLLVHARCDPQLLSQRAGACAPGCSRLIQRTRQLYLCTMNLAPSARRVWSLQGTLPANLLHCLHSSKGPKADGCLGPSAPPRILILSLSCIAAS